MNLITTTQEVSSNMNLTYEEMRILSAYRQMNDKARSIGAAIFESFADTPSVKKPSLRLIAGGLA